MHENINNNNSMKLSIIIPMFNEKKTIIKLLQVIEEQKFIKKQIIIVDDCSTDNSLDLVKSYDFKDENLILSHKINKGKGASIQSAQKHINGDYVIIQDADLEYDPNDILTFLRINKKFNYDLIMGSRFIGSHRSVLNFWHMLGNKLITFLFNFLNNTTFTDIYCCYCMFKRNLIDVDKLKCHGWGQQAEILTYVINKKSKLHDNSDVSTFFTILNCFRCLKYFFSVIT